MISPFLNFDSSTGDFLKNAKISLVLLIGPFLIRTGCVYETEVFLNFYVLNETPVLEYANSP